MTKFAGVSAECLSSKKLSAFMLACLFIIETVIFYWTVTRNVSPFYPINFDQVSYYFDSYAIIDKGWLAVIDEFIHVKHPTGVGLTAQGAIFGLLFGANRTVIVSLNLIYFLALQLALFRVIFERTRSFDLAWFSLALIIACPTIFNRAGGIYDFRPDFLALCLYGVLICSILWSETFLYASRSWIVAAAAIVLISFRFFTALYVAGILSCLLTILVWSAVKSNSSDDRSLARLRARNLLAASIVIALIAAPLLFGARHELYEYYLLGHVLGEEKYIRAHQLGLYTVLDHVLYYPKSVYKDHLGWLSVALTVFIFAFSVGIFLLLHLPKEVLLQRLKRYGLDLIVLGIGSLIPIAALTTDIAKSPVVAGIIIVPIIMLFTFLCAVFWPTGTSEGVGQDAARKTVRVPEKDLAVFFTSHAEILREIGVVVAVTLGLGYFVVCGLAPPDDKSMADLHRITEINDAIDRYVIQNSLTNPGISFDRVTDYMNLPTVKLFFFERYHRIIYFQPLFGNYNSGIFATPSDVAMQLIMKSDIVVLTDPVRGRPGYPMDKKITEYWDEIAAWTRKNRTLFYSTVILGVPHEVYVRFNSPGGNSK